MTRGGNRERARERRWRLPAALALVALAVVGLPGHAAVSAAAAADTAVELSGLTLKDQFGNQAGLKTDAETIQIVIVVSAKRLRRLKAWEEALWEYDPSLTVLRVADVPRTAPTEYETVAARLRKRLPEDLNVLVDLDGVWAKHFELDSSAPTVLVFSPSGQLEASHHGMHSRERFDALEADLERLERRYGSDASTSAGAQPP